MTSGHTGCLFVTTLRLSLQLHTADEGEKTNKLLGEQVCTLLTTIYSFVLYFL